MESGRKKALDKGSSFDQKTIYFELPQSLDQRQINGIKESAKRRIYLHYNKISLMY